MEGPGGFACGGCAKDLLLSQAKAMTDGTQAIQPKPTRDTT